MTIQMPSSEMERQGYKRVACYYNKAGERIVCWTGFGQQIIRFHSRSRGHARMFTRVYTDRKAANDHMRRLVVPGVMYKSFQDGLYVRDRKSERLYGIAQ